MRATRQQRQKFTALLFDNTRESNGDLRAAERLMRYGATLARIAELECSGPLGNRQFSQEVADAIIKRWNEEGWPKMAAKRERIQDKVIRLCASLRATPVFSNDPRGCCLKIAVTTGKTDDWGREGICVPTA